MTYSGNTYYFYCFIFFYFCGISVRIKLQFIIQIYLDDEVAHSYTKSIIFHTWKQIVFLMSAESALL